jgi:hypothetical protein
VGLKFDVGFGVTGVGGSWVWISGRGALSRSTLGAGGVNEFIPVVGEGSKRSNEER